MTTTADQGDPMPKQNLSLPDHVIALLDKVGDGNRSEYVATILEQRWQEWQQALDTLREAGWRAPELLAACDALNGCGLLPDRWQHAGLALELHDAERLNQTASRQWDVPPERWQERVQQVHEHPAIGRALYLVAREFWSSNDEVEHAIRRLGASTTTVPEA
jgi:hypothetical protein